ncbi:MAG: tol-pal system protein YbgF [Pseudomonadota bacterium]
MTVASIPMLSAQTPDYVDVEAERAAGTLSDPFAPPDTQAYPATSFGVGSAPAAPTGQTALPAGSSPAVTSAPTTPAPTSTGGQNLGFLFSQIQQLQQQVMELNGRLEEQAHQLRTLQEQSLQRYVDLDSRIAAASGAGASPAVPASAPPPPVPIATTIPGNSPTTSSAGEAEAYRAAYSLVQSKRFDQAVSAFKQFQQDYPAGQFAPNAYYWLGELYLVIDPADLESSRQAFAMLLSQYPDNNKAPDALYKLGKVQFMKGNPEKAREYLDQVVTQYGSTNSSAVKLAQDFIAENY